MLAARPGILLRSTRNISFTLPRPRISWRKMTSSAHEVKFNASLTEVDTDAYDSQLAAKQKLVEEQFAEFNAPALEVFRSKPKNYRMRSVTFLLLIYY